MQLRIDPLRGFRFLVEIDALTVGGFSKVKGLTREVRLETYREGGVNDYEHKLMTQVGYGAVTLERGLALPELWIWAQDAADGEATRRTVRILLMNETGIPTWAWQLDSALPAKWSVSDLDAASSQTTIESLEIAHHGLRRATA
ncbi:MAG TPA: phage tail protein [Rhizomicrobium sp.]|nr:phage tail protein [Rhizomicrobium sp.]